MNLILQKIFGLRNKIAAKRGNPQREMPFLDHLEELRQTLFRILVTLLVTVVVAFGVHKWLFDVMRAPIELAGLGIVEENHLPSGLTETRWKEVNRISRTVSRLPAAYLDAYLDAACKDDPDLRHWVSAISLFRAAVNLPQEQGPSFIEAAAGTNEEVRRRAFAFFDKMPHVDADTRGNLILMTALGPTEGFMLSIKLSFFAGLALAFPLLFYFSAQFVFPGLTPKEKRIILPYLGVGIFLFVLGVLFCYYEVTPRALKFFHHYNVNMGVESEWRIGYYISFVTKLTLGFGISFQLPVVVMILVALDLLSVELMQRTRAYAVIIIVTIAALITPTPDVITLSFLAGPMLILYEITIWIAWFVSRRRRLRDAAEEAERALWRQKKHAKALATAPSEPEKPAHPDLFLIEENAYRPEPSRSEDASARAPDQPPPEGAASSPEDPASDEVYEEGFGPSSPPTPRPAQAIPYGGLDDFRPDTLAGEGKGRSEEPSPGSSPEPDSPETESKTKDSVDESSAPEQDSHAGEDPSPKPDHGPAT
ncbi:MAG TPA: twin-arginine translocase subunit TatC [Verrucomicrobiales bacterium]|nr:twin-arginine translocase subunit TatC [Verrucomicrobiales bacterium]